MEGVRILDLFSGAGGAAMGLHRAFPEAEIIGVDIKPQRNYPFIFVQADAMEYPLEGFDFIWASPPCQAYTIMQNICKNKDSHPDLIVPVRNRLQRSNLPFVIENVVGAPLDVALMLCGTMFGLPIIRHRIFEANFELFGLMPPCRHINIYDPWHGEGGLNQRVKLKKAMNIDWEMTRTEVREAIPPAYSEYIGNQLKTVMSHKKAVSK